MTGTKKKGEEQFSPNENSFPKFVRSPSIPPRTLKELPSGCLGRVPPDALKDVPYKVLLTGPGLRFCEVLRSFYEGTGLEGALRARTKGAVTKDAPSTKEFNAVERLVSQKRNEAQNMAHIYTIMGANEPAPVYDTFVRGQKEIAAKLERLLAALDEARPYLGLPERASRGERGSSKLRGVPVVPLYYCLAEAYAQSEEAKPTKHAICAKIAGALKKCGLDVDAKTISAAIDAPSVRSKKTEPFF